MLRRLLADTSCGYWSFQRLRDDRTGTCVRLSFHASTQLLDELENECEKWLSELGWQVMTDREWMRSDARTARESADAATMMLSTLSSDLALTLFADGGGLPAAAKRAFAVAHLLHLVALVPVNDRATFLFTCWQDWSARMSPAQRVTVAREADKWHACPVKQDTEIAWDRCRPFQWERYLDSVREFTVDAHDAGLPVKYLLFNHARMTNNRVGISADNEGFAAWLLRASLANGDIGKASLPTGDNRVLATMPG